MKKSNFNHKYSSVFGVFWLHLWGEVGREKAPQQVVPFFGFSVCRVNSKGNSKSKNEENFTWGLSMEPKKSLEKVKISQGEMWPMAEYTSSG